MPFIQHITPYLPGKTVRAADLPEISALQGPEKEYFETATGIETLLESPDLSGYDLAQGAAARLLATHGIDPLEIDVLIHIRARIPEAFIHSEAMHLQHALGCKNALTFALSDLGCADSSMAIRLAKDLLTANRRYKKVLVCYGHKQYSPPRYRYPVTVQGDGGLAFLVTREEGHEIMDLEIQSNGYYWDLFTMPYQDRSYTAYQEQCTDPRRYGFELAIESKNRFQDMIRSLTERNGLQIQDFSHYLLQNISKRAYEYYESAFGFTLSPVCRMNLSRYGHLGCADILLNLHTGVENSLFQPGDHVLILNNSPVAAWSVLWVKI